MAEFNQPKHVVHEDGSHDLSKEVELEIKLEKAETQMKIARMALISMIIFTAYLISPWGPPVETIEALDTTLATFMVAQASIVGAYMGFTAWMSRN